MPATMASKLDMTSPLLNSFKPYKWHVLLQTAKKSKEWENEVSEDSSFDVLKKIQQDGNNGNDGRIIMTTYTSDQSAVIAGSDLVDGNTTTSRDILLPRGIYFDNSKLSADSALATLEGQPLGFSHVVMVCAHLKRDKKCGVIGPMLIAAFEEEILKEGLTSGVLILPISHTGNLIKFNYRGA
jgi:hypothetical protein